MSRNDFPLGSRVIFFQWLRMAFESLQIVFEIGDEVGPEIFGGQSLGLVFFQQPVDAFLIVGFEQFKDFPDVLLADEDMAFLELGDDALVGVDEAPERGRNAVKLLSRRFTVRIFMNLARLRWLWISCSSRLPV